MLLTLSPGVHLPAHLQIKKIHNSILWRTGIKEDMFLQYNNFLICTYNPYDIFDLYFMNRFAQVMYDLSPLINCVIGFQVQIDFVNDQCNDYLYSVSVSGNPAVVDQLS